MKCMITSFAIVGYLTYSLPLPAASAPTSQPFTQIQSPSQAQNSSPNSTSIASQNQQAQQTQSQSSQMGTSSIKKLSYTMGYETGKAFKANHVHINVDAFSQGLSASLTNAAPALSEQEMKQLMNNYQRSNTENSTVPT